jgi:hypothetical protein
MRELCAHHGFHFLDLKPALVEASGRVFKETGGLLWWRDDTHWNVAGQRAAAAVIYESLLGGEGRAASAGLHTRHKALGMFQAATP